MLEVVEAIECHLEGLLLDGEPVPIPQAGEIASVDRSIDELVYQLYGLTEDEIKIVEGK